MMIRRFAVIAAFSLWMGGFTFYSSFAIPASTRILGSHRAAGFITQDVTRALNAVAAAALAILFWNLVSDWRHASAGARRGMTVAWVFLAVLQAALFWLHPILDTRLDPAAQSIAVNSHFDAWHRAYLWISTAQWLASLPLLWAVLSTWARRDRMMARAVSGEVAADRRGV
jgi:hypothetical protein